MANEEETTDGYVRIPTLSLPSVDLHLLISEIDLSIAVPDGVAATITGYTEWVGSWRDLPLTIGWDWAVVEDAVVVLNPNEIRTNIQLVYQTGHAEQPSLAKLHLLHWIESLPWQAAIRELLDEQ